MLKAIVVGNVVREPEMKTTRTGYPVCQFNIAADLKAKNQDGTKKSEFILVSAFGKLGEVTGKYLHKGRKVTCSGELSGAAYTGSDGQAHYSLRMNAEDVEFMMGRNAEEEEQKAQDAAQVQNAYKQSNGVPEGFVEVDSNELPF